MIQGMGPQVMHQDLPSLLLDWSRVDVEAPTPGGDLIVDKTCRTGEGTGGIHRLTVDILGILPASQWS